MKADDLDLDELLDFGDGWVGLKGRRLVLHSIHAFALGKLAWLSRWKTQAKIPRFHFFPFR